MSIQETIQRQTELEKQKIKETETDKRYILPPKEKKEKYPVALGTFSTPDDPSITLNIEKIAETESRPNKNRETKAEKKLRIISNSKVDFEFIKELEGYTLKGVIPDAKGSDSGVTVASGFDLGQRNVNDLKGLSKSLKDKLTKYLGRKGIEAEELLEEFPLTITEEEANALNKKAKEEAIVNLYDSWYDATGKNFNNLDQGQQTTLASVSFQYGDLPSRTPNFWSKATQGKWNSVYNELMNFRDRYPTRREKEAAYLESYLNPLISKVSNIEGQRN